MNLNCLNCQTVPRTDSDKDLKESFHEEKLNCGLCLGGVERSWSGNLAPPRPYEKMRTASALVPPKKKVKKAPHRVHSGPIEYESCQPRLVRSCGMRRDWSFEDVRQIVKG